MAIQEKDAVASDTSNGSDIATYPYKASSTRHIVWKSITTPFGAIFISVVVMVALLSFGMGASLTSNGSTSTASKSSSSTNMTGMQATPVPNVPNAIQEYGNQLAKYTIDPDGAKHFTFTAQQVMW